MYKVRKKDGRVEDFDRNKILRGATNAGATPEEANQVAAAIESWLPTVAVETTVNSVDVRAKVLEVLRGLNPTAAANFETYQKTAAAVPPETVVSSPQAEPEKSETKETP